VRQLIDKLRLAVARSTWRWATRVLAEQGDVVGLASDGDSATAELAPETADGPPAHWLEMVRARAPQLLRDGASFGAARSLADVRWVALSSLREAPVGDEPRDDADRPTRRDLKKMTSSAPAHPASSSGQRIEARSSRTPAASASSEPSAQPSTRELSRAAGPSPCTRPVARRSASTALERPPLLCLRSASDDLVALAPSPREPLSLARMASDVAAAGAARRVTSPRHLPPARPSRSRALAADHAGATDAAADGGTLAWQAPCAEHALAGAADCEAPRGSASTPSPPSRTTLWPQLPDENDTPAMQPSWPPLPVEDLVAALDPVDYDELERRARLRGEQQGARWSEPRF
jgi:hypothetical protein